MKKSLFVSLLFCSAAAAFAQSPAPPVVKSIVPPGAPTSGGTLVTITGDNLTVPPNFACFAPCPTRVSFGETTVDVREEAKTALVVVTPPHAPGTVDVKVTTGDGRSVTAPGAFVYSVSPEANYQRILLPIYLEVKTP